MDPDDRAAEPLLVGADLGGEVSERRLASMLAAQLFAGGLDLAPLAADASGPRILPEGVDHRAANAPFGKCLELDAASLVEAVRRVDEPDDSILHQIADVDRVRHRRRDAAGELLDEGDAGNDSRILLMNDVKGAHERDLRTRIGQRRYHTAEPDL